MLKLRTVLLMVLIGISTAGCLRSAADELDNPESRIQSSATAPPSQLPTYTPYPTFTELPTTDALAAGQSAQTIPTDDLGQAVGGPLEQPTQDLALAQAQPEATLDPGYVLATEIVATSTQAALDKTATALGPVIELPTSTPTFDPLVPTSTPEPLPVGSDCIHEVRAGENMYRISVTYGLLVDEIARASGITNSNLIFIGQKLTIPGCGTTGALPPPTTIPTQVPGSVATTPPLATSVPSAGGIRHNVVQGETLFQIAQRYGVTVDAIVAANGITNPNLIKFNTVLVIP